MVRLPARLKERIGPTMRQSLLSIVDQGLVSVGNFATSVVVGRLAGLDGLGAYSLAFALLIIAATVHESFVAIPYTVYGSRLDEKERQRLAGTSLVHALIIGATLTALVGLVAVIVWIRGGSTDVRDVLFIAASVMVLTLVREFARRHAFAELRVGVAVAIDAVATGVQLGGLLLLAVFDAVSAVTVVAVMGLAAAVTGAAWFMSTRAEIEIDSSEIGTVWRRHWAYGRWMAAARLTSVAHGYAVNWLLAAMLSLREAGGYAAAATIVAVTNPVLIGVGMVLTPRAAHAFAAGGHDEVDRLVRKATGMLTVLSLVLAVPVAVFGGTVLEWAYGPEFAGFGGTVAVLAAALVASVVGMGAEAGLRAIERPSVSFAASAAGVTVTTVVTLIAVPHIGAIGGAWGVLTGAVVSTSVKCGIFFSRRADGDDREEGVTGSPVEDSSDQDGVRRAR